MFLPFGLTEWNSLRAGLKEIATCRPSGRSAEGSQQDAKPSHLTSFGVETRFVRVGLPQSSGSHMAALSG
jgi:hypothetical protein